MIALILFHSILNVSIFDFNLLPSSIYVIKSLMVYYFRIKFLISSYYKCCKIIIQLLKEKEKCFGSTLQMPLLFKYNNILLYFEYDLDSLIVSFEISSKTLFRFSYS